MRRLPPVLACALVALTGCAPADDALDGTGDGLLEPTFSDGKADGLGAAPKGRFFKLAVEHGAFTPPAGHPGALVYVPDGFDATPPVDVIVYLHGFYNCVENVVRASGAPCTRGGPARQAYALPAQLDAAKKNALLVLPELAYDQASADPGHLGDDGALRAFLGDVFAQLGDVGSFGVDDAGTVVVASHSGGYRTAAALATRGGVPVTELWLLDSLYGSFDSFDAWVTGDLDGLGGSPPARRFAVVYTGSAGTLKNSQAMAGRAAGWVGSSGALVDDRTTATWPDATFAHGLLFKRTGLTHDGVPRYYFGRLAVTSLLRPL